MRLTRATWDFLFGGDDLPWGLQVFWKLLCWTLVGLLIYGASITPEVEGKAFLYVLAVVFGLAGLFTKLGDG